MRLLVVIVNYRTGPLAVDCLRSLVPEVAAVPGTRVVVVDGNSSDDSVPILRAAIDEGGWRRWAELMPLAENGGFAYGNNAAIRPALASSDPPDFVFLLNPDTVVRPGVLAQIIGHMEARPGIGIAGPKLVGPDEIALTSAFRFPTVLGQLESTLQLGVLSRLLASWVVRIPPAEQAHSADWLGGAAMMIRREVFEQIGLLDEQYFLYFEEVDFCLRARRLGWSIWYLPQSTVAHLEGQATGFNDPRRRPQRVPCYWFESRRRFFATNHGRLYARLADVAWLAGTSGRKVRHWLPGKKKQDPPLLLSDFLRHTLGFRLWSG